MKSNINNQVKKAAAALAIVAGIGILGAQAQESKTSANATVNVIFQDYLAIQVNHNEVDLVYATADDYKDGVEVSKKDHLTVSSAKSSFTVGVRNENRNAQLQQTGGGSGNILNGSDITVEAYGNDFGAGNSYQRQQLLQDTYRTIFTSNKRVAGGNIDVKYSTKNGSLKGDQAYNHVGRKFSTTVTYNIAVN